MIAPARDSIGVEIVETAAEIGFDYIELSLRDVTELSAPAYARLRARMARVGLPCEACNNFFPARLRLTGAEADPAAGVRPGRAHRCFRQLWSEERSGRIRSG
jgi:hypothetical protein